MTNVMIIAAEQIRLQQEGVLRFTGKKIKARDLDGNIVELDEIQPIHTFQRWKALGYRVKKGEKSFIKFPIWKYTNKKVKEGEEEEAAANGYCFMKMSAFFTDEQVEKEEV